MNIPRIIFVVALACATAASAQTGNTSPADHDVRISHTPPVGPPWVRDFAEARTLALQSGKPIFLYSTKTY